jgi:hypothetical protein
VQKAQELILDTVFRQDWWWSWLQCGDIHEVFAAHLTILEQILSFFFFFFNFYNYFLLLWSHEGANNTDIYGWNVSNRSTANPVWLEQGIWTDWDGGEMHARGDICCSPLAPCCVCISLLLQK